MDAEFASVQGARIVLFCIAIRDAKTNAIMLRTAINYGFMSLHALQRL